MKITLGSTSTHKLDALHQACRKLNIKAIVTGIEAVSGQNEQPIELDETLAGALARAKAAQKHCPEGLAVGIESGIFRRNGGDSTTNLDIAIIVILVPDGRQIITTSPAIEFPDGYVRLAEERGFKNTTVGSVITERLGGSREDPHSVLTNGKVTRTMLLADALTAALRQY